MSKSHIFIVFLASMVSLPLYSMTITRPQLKPWKYTPSSEKHIPTAIAKRDPLELYPDLAPKLNPNIKIIREATPDELENRCDYFALKQATGFAQQGPFHDRVEIIANCFHQTKKPSPKDIVVFTMDTDSLDPLHFAVVKSVLYPKRDSLLSKKPKPILTVESKWGAQPYIFEHRPFDVPTCYGMCYGVFTLNDEYKNQIL